MLFFADNSPNLVYQYWEGKKTAMADPDLQIRWGAGGGGNPDPEIMGGGGLKKLFSRPLGPKGGGGTWINVCWVYDAGLSEPLPHYSLFFGQL